MMGFGGCKILPVTTCINLWEVLARHIIEYAAEVCVCVGIKEGKKQPRNSSLSWDNSHWELSHARPTRCWGLGLWELKARRDKARLKLYEKWNSPKWSEYTSMLVDGIREFKESIPTSHEALQ